jgi:endogenous inhibitor of DNA gyrase (YacG/DUF329 family)
MTGTSHPLERQIYVSNAEIKFRLPADQIKGIIEDEFGGFDPKLTSQYDERLALVRSQRPMPLANEKERIPDFIPDAKCPICGSRIRHNYRWKSKNKEMQPFSCERTEISHYLEWRTGIIAQRFKEHYQKYPDSLSLAGSCPNETLGDQENA